MPELKTRSSAHNGGTLVLDDWPQIQLLSKLTTWILSFSTIGFIKICAKNNIQYLRSHLHLFIQPKTLFFNYYLYNIVKEQLLKTYQKNILEIFI